MSDQLQDGLDNVTDGQARGSEGDAGDSNSEINFDAAMKSEDFKAAFQSAVDSAVRKRIDKYKANQLEPEKQETKTTKKEEASEIPDIDAIIEEKLKAYEAKANEKRMLEKKAARFGIEMSELEGKSPIEIMDLFETKISDISKKLSGGSDLNPAAQPKGKIVLTDAEKAHCKKVKMDEAKYLARKKELIKEGAIGAMKKNASE